MRVLYLAHDLDDSAIWRRHEMLRLGGADVTLAGFRRGEGALSGPAVVLGRTRNGRMVSRVLSVLRTMAAPPERLLQGPAPDVVLARNLEMLVLAVSLRRQFPQARVVYELLDVHRLLLGDGAVSKALRAVEARLLRRTSLVIISSPGFQRGYLEPFRRPVPEVMLVENKPLATAPVPPAPVMADGPIRIGWFGILRCAWSLAALDRLTRAAPGRYRVTLRGRPALDVLPDFHEVVSSNADFSYLGPYRWPDDLAQIYAGVDLAWLIDRYEAGGNSDWLLPNRLYEGGLHGAIPLALAGTETADRLRTLGIGVIVERPLAEAVDTALATLDRPSLAPFQEAVRALPRATWEAVPDDCRALVARLAGTSETAAVVSESPSAKVLIAIPALNEAAHIGEVLNGLIPFARRTGSLIVVADGGSTDGTQEIVRQMAEAEPSIRLIDNPARLQSAAINLAVHDFGDEADWLLRIDAHSAYPADYCDRLLADAQRTGADSVVVSMKAVGKGPLQRLIALAQNSRLGNGGAAHRNSARGRWVDHGHHALMRIAAFRAVGGYDESFSHNEDAELDHRLRAAGHRIWLTAETGLDYFPRRTLGSLMLQYFRFGRGRARNVLKHRAGLGPRQAAVAALAPLLLLAPLAPLQPVLALPLVVWVLACLAGGISIAVAGREPRGVLSGFLAGAMHLAWSAGFWAQTVAAALRQRSAA
ncbi:glycosyltransferase family 2 protein [Tabrizicola sp.]|uniref:glycosyltransferase family 2 protein n=1 Tax=Tabrizicola sp. TaxID=2005166 RepID=UPI003F3AE153